MSALNPPEDFPQIATSGYGSNAVDLYAPAGAESDAQRIVQRLFKQPEPMANSTTRRIVQVFIADPDVDVPLDDALLFKSDPKFTDATDQELYFEVPIVELLKSHNEKRKTWLDKDATRKAGKDVFLEAAKIRDLKMVVVNIAQF